MYICGRSGNGGREYRIFIVMIRSSLVEQETISIVDRVREADPLLQLSFNLTSSLTFIFSVADEPHFLRLYFSPLTNVPSHMFLFLDSIH